MSFYLSSLSRVTFYYSRKISTVIKCTGFFFIIIFIWEKMKTKNDQFDSNFFY